MAPPASTRRAPKRSAIAPANGCAAPHNRFCTASASENTSRPQPLSSDIGVKKKPSAERGPNERTAIRQPHMMITPGVRQLIREVAASRVVMDKVSQAFEISQTDASIAKCKLSAQWLEGSPARVEKISRALQGSNQIEILELTASFTHGSHPGRLR